MKAVQSPAWWVWLVAASFLLHFGLSLRSDWVGRPTLRLLAAYDGRSVIVQNVYARSEAVPLKRGDRIIRADDHVLASDADWFVVLFTLRVSKPVVFEIQRDTQHLQVPVTPEPRYFRPRVLVFARIGQMMM